MRKGDAFVRAILQLAVLAGCGHAHTPDRPPELVLLPDGFVGWVRLDYGVEGAPPLPREGESVVLRFPDDGYLKTSSVLKGSYGLRVVQYYAGERRVPLPDAFHATGGFTTWKPDDKVTSAFYHFGTEADATATAPDVKDADDNPVLGKVRPDRRLLH